MNNKKNLNLPGQTSPSFLTSRKDDITLVVEAAEDKEDQDLDETANLGGR